MNWFREHLKLTTILIIILIMIIIIIVSYENIGKSSFLGRSVTSAFTFVQEPISGVGNAISRNLGGIFHYRSTLRENDELKDEISKLKREMIQIKLTEAELKELKDLSSVLGYENVSEKYDFVTADVIAIDGSNWFNFFTINAGTEDGLYKDAVVINGDGLIGRVFEVGPDWAKIISVIDESNSVSFKVLRDLNLLGILSGDGSGNLEGYMLDPEASIIEGDILITSGIGMYPEGIVIGKVTNVVWNNDTLLKTVSIEPSAYFKNLQKVSVLVKK